jgi:large subunit ribosomal protein L25
MIPEGLVLEANKRAVLGKAARKRRASGILPGVVYGRDVKAIPLEISRKEFLRVFKEAGENMVFKLAITEDGKRDVRNVLIHDVAVDSLARTPLHVDFYQVRLDEAVRVTVPLEFIGESPAVENDGGVLVKSLQEIEIEALPGKIPEAIQVDVSRLASFEDAIHVRDLAIPPDVKVVADLDSTVATVQPPRTDEELKALEQAPVAVAPEEIITEAQAKKKAEEEASSEPEAQPGTQQPK